MRFYLLLSGLCRNMDCYDRSWLVLKIIFIKSNLFHNTLIHAQFLSSFLLVLPYLYYCDLVWGSTYKSNLKRLTTLQKRAISLVSRSGCDAHTDPIFLNGIHLLQLGQFMYSFSTGNLPTKFDSFFSVNKCIHSYNTRYASFFRLPLCRTDW